MAIGDVYEVTLDDCTDLYYLDTGMYDTEEYGAVYILDAERPAIVDTGIGTHYERTLDALDEIGIAREDVAVIAPTHVHLDHAGGAGFLADACPNADVFVPEIGAHHLVDPERLVEGTKRAVGDQWQFYVEPEPVPEERVVEISDGDVIDLGDHQLETIHAPGHAPHQVVFYDPANDALFTADAAGIWVPSVETVRETTPPPNFDLEGCLEDVESIREVSPTTLLYPHYGPRLYSEAAMDEYADVLESWVEAVEAKRAELGDDDAVVSHFVDEQDIEAVWGEEKARAEVAMNVRGVLRYLDTRDEK